MTELEIWIGVLVTLILFPVIVVSWLLMGFYLHELKLTIGQWWRRKKHGY